MQHPTIYIPYYEKEVIYMSSRSSASFTLLLLSGLDASVEQMSALAGCTADRVLSFTPQYTPPYDTFAELRRLQLAVRRRSETVPPEALFVDLSEWLPHLAEEYFTVMVKFFTDYPMRYVFAVRTTGRQEALPLLALLCRYMPGTLVKDETFLSADSLSGYLLRHSDKLTSAAAQMLAMLLLEPESEDLRSYRTLSLLLSQFPDISPSAKSVTLQKLEQLRRDSGSVFSALFPDTLIKGKKGYDIEQAV